MTHQPVLLQEALQGLAIQLNGLYIDGTFGRGGHSRAILAALGEKGRLIAIDQDPDAIQAAQLIQDPRFTIRHACFDQIAAIAESLAVTGQVDGILLDLGVSSPQLDNPERGFSFAQEGPLDMRMNPEAGKSAAQWLQEADEKTIADVLWRYGEERFSRKIARAIVSQRQNSPLLTTGQLSGLIAKAIPKREKHKHPATRSFQAIRIFINRELEALSSCLAQSLDILKPQGRLCVISFHSLEDRMVKQFIREHSESDLPPDLPIKAAELKMRLKKVGGLIKPSEEEIKQNPRARSARCRIAEKLE